MSHYFFKLGLTLEPLIRCDFSKHFRIFQYKDLECSQSNLYMSRLITMIVLKPFFCFFDQVIVFKPDYCMHAVCAGAQNMPRVMQQHHKNITLFLSVCKCKQAVILTLRTVGKQRSVSLTVFLNVSSQGTCAQRIEAVFTTSRESRETSKQAGNRERFRNRSLHQVPLGSQEELRKAKNIVTMQIQNLHIHI